MRDIEVAAGLQFVDVGLGFVAEHEPIAESVLMEYAADGRCFVATEDNDHVADAVAVAVAGDDDGADSPVGYLIVDPSGANAHIEQVSVHPSFQGRGLGRALVDQAELWALEHGFSGVTLTTFKDVAWNRPLYEHLGYVVLDDSELPAELKEIRDHETLRGLDPATRVCMRKAVSRTRSG
jgi:GNAT superfamily N-acetyltransferase